MSRATVAIVKHRANTMGGSPLALFSRPDDADGVVDCIFASTVVGQQRIKSDVNFIATVDRSDVKKDDGYIWALCHV